MLDKENTIAVTLPTSLRVLMPNGRVEEMKLETYLAGVVATEIGANAPLEALKAQAVASRTYAAAARRHPEHEADVCTTAHCQKWKHVDPVVAPEVFRALSETWGMIAIYDGKLIDAFFFEHCDGRTRNSEEMLMPSVKYLRGVDCSCGFLMLKGHGIGMCKRGAIVMARRSASFEQILRHYYRGVVVIHTARENIAPEPEQVAPAAEPPVETPAPAPRPRVYVKKTVAPPVEPPAPAPKPRSHFKASSVPPPVAPPVETPKVEPETRKPKPPRPTVRRAPVHTEPPVSKPQHVEPAAEKPYAVNAAEEASVIVEPAQKPPRPPRAANTEKLRDVLVGEVVAKSEPIVTEPSKPTKPPRRVHIDHLPGSRMIAGCLPEPGVSILIEGPQGNKIVTASGSAVHYGEGGFETMVEEDGRYLVTLDDQVVEVNVTGETVFLHVN
ncbi:MAG TPA: SpoIID/LytB domain-containing protein [Anaerolineae bacterium]